MKNLILITSTIFLLAQTLGYSQDNAAYSQKQEASLTQQNTNAQIATQNDKFFVGTYLLEEAGFELEIVKEDGKMYIVTEFSKDILMQKNATTLHEITRGVDLALIENNKDALKFTQNGYETTIKRVNPSTKK